MTKKMISPHIKWFIEKCPEVCTFFSKLAHGTLSSCFITQLFRSFGIIYIEDINLERFQC